MDEPQDPLQIGPGKSGACRLHEHGKADGLVDGTKTTTGPAGDAIDAYDAPTMLRSMTTLGSWPAENAARFDSVLVIVQCWIKRAVTVSSSRLVWIRPASRASRAFA